MTDLERLHRENFLSVPLDLISRESVIRRSTQAMRERICLQLGDVNVAKIVEMQHDMNLRRYIEESDIICPDGMGVVWGGRLAGLPIKERITGIDLMIDLLAVCEREGFRPYFLGAKPIVVIDLIRKLEQTHPKLQIAGSHHGYFSAEEENGVVANIKASNADCIFVGMTSPMKERFLNTYRDQLGVSLQMGVGGSFDVISGHIKRAPVAMQKLGFEWLFRLLQEPRRLSHRYYVANTGFIVLLAKNLISRARQRIGFTDRRDR